MTTNTENPTTLVVPWSSFEVSPALITTEKSTITVPASILNLPELTVTKVNSTLILTAGKITLSATNISLPASTSTEEDSATPGLAETTVTVTEYPERDNGSVSSAEAAGIGIGAAIAGIVLTLAAFAIFSRFKRRKPYLEPIVPGTVPNGIRAVPPARRTSVTPYPRNPVDDLPQRQGDKEYQQRLERLKIGIKNCVENFFSSTHTLTSEQKGEFQRLAGTAADRSTLIAALSDTNTFTRRYAIRSLIARMLFDRIDLRSHAEIPLLPPDIFGVYQSLMSESGYTAGRRPQSFGIESDRGELIATWRRITGAYLPRDLLKQQVRLAVQDMASTLAPLRPDPQNDFQDVLYNLGDQAAQLGLALFTIPEPWSPIWMSRGQHENRDLVIFPGVELAAQRNTGSKRLTEAYLKHDLSVRSSGH